MSGINVKDLSLENVLPHIVYCTKINVSLNHKGGGQISCHLITGSNVKDLSLGNVFLHKNKFIRDGSSAAT